jgi:glutaryl-CoA dehydrogenase
MEMARVDGSIATFFGVHDGGPLGSIYAAGSEEQKQKRLPPMARFEKIGCFGRPSRPWARSVGRPPDHGQEGGRHLGAQRPEEEWIGNARGATSR